MRAYVAGLGFAGPGFAGWEVSVPVLRGDTPYAPAATVVPPSDLLPPAERRRTGIPVRLALAVGSEALRNAGCDAAAAATVFTSSAGDGDNLHQICETLASADPALSPTRFHNSVHNAPAGYWSIAVRSNAPSTSIACYDASFGAGLLEAAAQIADGASPIVLIAYDHVYPDPLKTLRPLAATFGVAIVLTAAPAAGCIAALDVTFTPGGGEESTMQDAALEVLRAGIPAARSLPLLTALARGGQHSIAVDCGSGARLAIEVGPCS
jgi:hypothetical protein